MTSRSDTPFDPADRPITRLVLRRGVHLDDPPRAEGDLHLKRMEAKLPHLSEGSYFARASAALVHGLPLFHADLDQPHIVHTLGGHGRISDTVHDYKTPQRPPKIVMVDNFPVTSLARTASDLMRRTRFGPALAIADAALRLGCDRGELLWEVKGGRGTRHSTEAALRADALSESPCESLVRAQLLQSGVPMPTLQHEFQDQWGFIGRVDFYWERFNLVAEFDGLVKYTKLLRPGESVADVLARQGTRQRRLESLGVRVVRWMGEDVHAPGAIVASLHPFIGDVRVDHGMCPEAHDFRRPRRRAS